MDNLKKKGVFKHIEIFAKSFASVASMSCIALLLGECFNGKPTDTKTLWAIFLSSCGIVLFSLIGARIARKRSEYYADMIDGLPLPNKQYKQKISAQYKIQSDNFIKQCQSFTRKIDTVNALIPDKNITADLKMISQYVNDVFIQASKDESNERQIKKFINYYFPRTLRLCSVYIDLHTKDEQTAHIKEVKAQITQSISDIKYVFSDFYNDIIFRKTTDNIDQKPIDPRTRKNFCS